MIVKNEERFLEQCLLSAAAVVDEICIVDTGSTDRTIEIARSFGARIEEHAWRNDFAWARNKALDMARYRWILQLDADEELLRDSDEPLRLLKDAPAHLTGLWIRCFNASDRYHSGGQISHAIVRIFPNTERVRFHGEIHEFPSVDGAAVSMPAVNSPIKIVHHGYRQEIVAERGKYERNMAIIEANVAREPEEAFHWYNYGMTAHLGGDHQRGAEGLTKMWELCERNGMRAFTPNGLQTLSDIYAEHLHQPERGLPHALKAIELAPHYQNAHFSAGKAYFLMKRYDESRAMYREAIADGAFRDQQYVVDDEVSIWKAQCEIGSTYAEEHRDAEALAWFEQGIAAKPNVRVLRSNYAKSLERVGRLGEAEREFRYAYEQIGGDEAAIDCINFLLRHSREREAIAIIEREAPTMSAEAAFAVYVAAIAVAERFEWPEVEQYIERAAAVKPDAPEVAAARVRFERSRGNAATVAKQAQAAIAQGRHADAVRIAEDALQQYPGDPPLTYFAALGRANCGETDAALRLLQSVDVREFGDGPALMLAALLRERGMLDAACETAAHAVRQNGRNLDALLLKAALCEQLGKLDEAARTLQDAQSIGGQRVSVELAGFYLRQGRLEDAKRIASSALS